MILNTEQNRAALAIRGALAIKRKKQTELSKKIGINRVLLNLFLNRKLDLIPEDIKRIMKELNISDELINKQMDKTNDNVSV